MRAGVTSLTALAGLALALAVLPSSGRSQDEPPEGPVMGGTFASGDVAVTDIENALRTAHIDNFRAIGTSSITFQLQLTGPIDGAFKPETTTHRRGWMNEAAAYNIASYLGMDSVPPVVVRAVDRGQFLRRLDPEYEGDWDLLVSRIVFVSGDVRGAVSYWVPNLARTGDLDSSAGMLRWTAWLEPGSEVPPESQLLARDLSSMTVFDLVIGNPDRTSGGNMRTVENASVRLVVRDHNLAFAARPNPTQMDRMVGMLRRSHRFSRSLVERLSALDEAELRRITTDEIGGPLLDDAQIAGVLSRRDTALSWIGAQIEEHGEAAVLSFD
jgi:hypothetical protein